MANLERLTRIVNSPGRGLLGADARGGLHWLDRDLNVLSSSHSSAPSQDPAGDPVYAVTFVDDWIITRDKTGTISRWHADTLRLSDRLDAAATADTSLLLEGEQPAPTMLRGIGVWDGKLYTNNGYFQVVVIDLETFTIERIAEWPHGYDMLEWFCTDAPGVHAVSDRSGRIHLGSLPELSFPTVVQVDTSNVHRVVYDARHNRLWALGDAGIGQTHNIANGLITLGLDGTIGERFDYARNDVEGLVFSPDFSRVYTGGFDGELLIFDNTHPELRVAKRIGGFSHQIIDITIDEYGDVYTLTQDGEVTALTADGTVRGRLGYERQCVWDLQPVPGDDRALLAATDDGTALLRLVEQIPGHPALVLAGQELSGLGFTRRLVTLDDGWAGVFWPGTVRRVSGTGQVVWERQMPSISHTLSRSPDGSRLLVASNAGAIELDAATGEELSRIDDLPASAWAGAYLQDGSRLVATRNGVMAAYSAEGDVTWTTELGGYPKRLVVDGNQVRATGGGGIKEFEVGQPQLGQRFTELLDNTGENCVMADGILVAITYGLQVAAYDHASGELLGLHEDLPDFPKGIASLRGQDGATYVVIGGRGGYLRLYRLDRNRKDSVLTPLRDLWLPTATGDYPNAGAR
ncbi:PQQ-binding-like beta-propeller repeat protein [Streptomyces sp. H27-H1]|uniref:outer membrane protein assembly factor BamB family protein n=1 Tax=Streptomyces sp. H27-H1 TaxID=2996461 RepID=UPI0022707EE3|nr:PQQ-binding-like beta-propeller repeat protein [Streptomyces sp. H27-H1]MCY0931252.1 PQQ-binding-like beta-propeller repeat protein [Streptomyces sp. H27-H1]